MAWRVALSLSMTGNELRKLFTDFFAARDHRRVASSPLIPPDDPTLLFTTAGMVQFKPLWSGNVPLPYRRATTVQKCFRAGGKGSDLENVGRTLRHLTFFEMLGNFSFGDYFKKEAIAWAWEFVTDVLRMPEENLYVSIFREDDEAFDIWHNLVGLSAERIVRLGEKDNFWGPAGETGACGPCTEIYIDLGKELSCGKPDCFVGCDCERYLEFWNLVFPQYDQQKDGTRLPLKNRGIDTGLGLERLACIVQKKKSLYETDLLYPIVEAACSVVGARYGDSPELSMSINVIVDHIRALTFVLSEGIVPSNEGRGYVLRRILRRAARHGKKIGTDQPFLYHLVDAVIDTMGTAYPEIKEHPQEVKKIIRVEEERFLRTLTQGIEILDAILEDLRAKNQSLIGGEDAFRLYDTYGFPLDLTYEIADEKGLHVDEEGFERCLKEQKSLARAARSAERLTAEEELLDDVLEQYGQTTFLGYETLSASSTIVAIIKKDARTQSISSGDEALVVLEETPFYAEAGGQLGDAGIIEKDGATFMVSDTQKTGTGLCLHKGQMTAGKLSVGDTVEARVDQEKRLATMRHHTATHLLQGALKRIVGKHITQSGSSVSPEHLRFDFTHIEPLSEEQLSRIEEMVNEQILLDRTVTHHVLPLEEARRMGAIAPFGEKYGATVRVIQIEDFSLEFCGGTHLDRTGKIGSFVIVSESSIASGIRRIEAVAGMVAFRRLAEQRRTLAALTKMLSASQDDIVRRIESLADETKSLRRTVQELRQAASAFELESLLRNHQKVKGVPLIVHKFQELEIADLRNLVDIVRAKMQQFIAVFGSVKESKVSLICAVSRDLEKKVPANRIVKEVAELVGGGGGGRADMAQAGGKDPEKLDEALARVSGIVERHL
jgi:alanyl-tRNA synthetase